MALWEAGWGRSLMALWGLPKRAIKLRPQPASQRAINPVPNRPPTSLFGSVSNPKLIWSHMIVFFEAFIKMSCISKMQFFHNF